MEITIHLAVGQLVSIAQQAAEAASQPGRGRRRTRVTLAQVDRGALHYSVMAPSREAQIVTVRFAEDGDLMRISVDGDRDDAAGIFVSELSRRIQAEDPVRPVSPVSLPADDLVC